MQFTGSCRNWCVAAMGTLVTFLLYSDVMFYVVIIADSFHWILVTVHRYTASQDSLKHANCSDFIHSNNPVTEDNPYGINPDNAT